MEERKPVIMVDMDDTLNDFAKTYWKNYNEMYGEQVDFQTVNNWNLQQFVRPDVDAYGLLRHPGLFRHLPLRDYAVEFMQHMYDRYEVYIVTDSPPGTSHCDAAGAAYSNPADDKRKWLAEHFPFLPQDRVIICAHKWMIAGDVLVDDKPATFEKFTELGKKCILMDMPYNQHIDTKWRAHNLREAEQMVEAILQESAPATSVVR
ncbi:5' nucleotidase, NT5C type [Ornithinibacillus gellani]|uniref:5' nucleotidase, NT5C type n=1 Tax=Ornithinibacillus gellani TaxID=2293253 RepID=UPI0016813AF9|nr:hypothetical protein [Ornithinibacillus gellani]